MSRAGPSPDELDPGDQQYLDDAFGMAPDCNITIEDKFARCRKHMSHSCGRCPNASTVASNHGLSEFKSMHSTAKQRFLPLNVINRFSIEG